MKPREILAAFDRYLAERGLRLEAVVIGGSVLNLLGVVARPTKDCDILSPPLPEPIRAAARAFAAERRRLGEVLEDELEQQDLNPDWPAHVCATVADLGRRLSHAV